MNLGADLIFFFFLAFLVFGPKKLPEIARLVGKTMGDLRRASNEFRFSLEEEIRNAEIAEEAKKAQATLTAHPAALPEAEASGASGEDHEGVEREGQDWQPEHDPAWKDVEDLHEPADSDAGFDAGLQHRGARGWHEPELDPLAAAGAPDGPLDAEPGTQDALPREPPAPEPSPTNGATGARADAVPVSEPPALAGRPGGVPGTVPAAERSWPAPERGA